MFQAMHAGRIWYGSDSTRPIAACSGRFGVVSSLSLDPCSNKQSFLAQRKVLQVTLTFQRREFDTSTGQACVDETNGRMRRTASLPLSWLPAAIPDGHSCSECHTQQPGRASRLGAWTYLPFTVGWQRACKAMDCNDENF